MSLLTLQQMQDRLAKMSFLNFKMEITEGFAEGPHFHAVGEVDDSVKVGGKAALDIHSPIPPQVSIEAFDLWIFARLKRAWIHECMEWLKVDGKPLFDPHRENADRDEYPVKVIRPRMTVEQYIPQY